METRSGCCVAARQDAIVPEKAKPLVGAGQVKPTWEAGERYRELLCAREAEIEACQVRFEFAQVEEISKNFN
jgi:hypothetical protein